MAVLKPNGKPSSYCEAHAVRNRAKSKAAFARLTVAQRRAIWRRHSLKWYANNKQKALGYTKAWQKKEYRRRRLSGMCVRTGCHQRALVVKGKTLCECKRHRNISRANYQRRRARTISPTF